MSVHELRVQPKTVSGAIGKHRYTIIFNPETRTWKWTVVVMREYTFTGDAATQDKAKAAIEKQIHKMENAS